MRYMKTFLCLVLFSALTYAQTEDYMTLKRLGKQARAKNILDLGSVASPSSAFGPSVPARPPQNKRTANSSITWSIIDSMSNVLGMASYELNPISYSPEIGMMSMVHRGDAVPPDGYALGYSTGALYYNVSSDGGATWPRMPDLLNQNDAISDTIAARYPSASMMAPTTDRGDAWFFAGYPNLTLDQAFGNAGTGYDFPIFADAPNCYTFHGDTIKQFGSLACTWASDSVMWIASEMNTPAGDYFGTAFFHTRTMSSQVQNYMVAPGLDTNRINTQGSPLGGDAIKVNGVMKMAFATGAYFYRHKDAVDSLNVVTPECIGVVYSSNQGTTWTGYNGVGVIDTVILADLPGLGDYKYWWRFVNFTNRIGGDMCLDTFGFPHCIIGVQKNASGVGVNVAIAEVYRDAGGWKAKIVAPANASTNYTMSGALGSVNQSGYSPFISRNPTGTAFVCQYNNSQWPDNNSDIYVVGRKLTSLNWISPINVTNTPGEPGWPTTNQFSEVISHMSNRMRRDSGNVYTWWSAYADPLDHTDCYDSPKRVYIRLATVSANISSVPYDYAAFNLITPAAGYTMTKDSAVNYFKAEFRNMGEEAATDSFDAKFRVLTLGGSVLYSVTHRLPYLPFQGSIIDSFPGPFTVPDTGTYEMQAIAHLAIDTSHSNDTNRGFLYVIRPFPICYTPTQKVSQTYTEFTDGALATYGDDSSSAYALPFQYQFDSNLYDSVNIATNGWIQFGKIGYGRDSVPYGMLHPISNGEGNANFIGFNTNSPRHMGAPWLEDLNQHITGDPNAGITYKAEGSSPNRTFTVQWRSMLAYYDSNMTTTRVNFQAKIHETTNLMEFIYGPVVPGTFAGSDTGAMIAIKDVTGGSYHYLDVYSNRSGSPSVGNTYLNPLTTWPGNNTAYHIYPNVIQKTVAIDNRWNLISNPFYVFDDTVKHLFPSATNGTTYGYTTTYVPSLVLKAGGGYWTKFPSAVSEVIQGGYRSSVDAPVLIGWNLVGGPSNTIAAPPSGTGIVISPFYAYHTGYAPASSLTPGSAYWVKTNAAGTLTLGPSAEPKTAPENFNAYDRFTIADNLGRSQTLFVTENVKGKMQLDRYEMPPMPPNDAFDARFTSNRVLEAYPSDVKTVEYAITMQSPVYPLEISFNVKNAVGKTIELVEVDKGKVVATHALNGDGKFVVAKGNANSLVIRVKEGNLLPKEFALGQNYPNPFNPTTRFVVAVPNDAQVDVVVYDILGRKITQILSGVQPAGYHTIEWEGRNDDGVSVPSGTYFIRMISGKFTAVRKVMLLK